MLSTETDASRLHLLKRRYQQINSEKRILKTKLSAIKRNIHATRSPELINDYLTEQKETQQQLKEISIQQTQFDLQLWVWDESYWKKY